MLFRNPIEVILRLLFLLPVLTIHEFSHAYAAYKMGDMTAKYKGRLTLNPFSHLDLIGTIALLTVGFGWAKPVPINPLKFRKQRMGMLWVSLAGPLSNLLSAFLALLALMLCYKFFAVPGIISQAVYTFVIMSISLGVFNLIPIPPLDGSKILITFASYKVQEFFWRYERYGIIALLLLIYVFSPVLSFIIGMVDASFFSIINLLIGWI